MMSSMPHYDAKAHPAPVDSCAPWPGLLQVEVTTCCNMRCAMCVKSAPGCRIPEAHMPLETFRRLDSVLPHCRGLVLNGVGEPLLHPRLPEMAAFARERLTPDAWLGFQTNGLLLHPKLASRLVQAGVDTLCLSVDAVEPAPDGRELHGQVHLPRLEQGFAMLRRAAADAGQRLRLGVEFVLMADTWRQLPAVLHWAGSTGADFAVISHVLPYDASMQGQSLFNPNTPKATAIFDSWKARARSEDLDFHDYLGILWKYRKTPKEQRLVDLVQAMQDEAHRRGVWIHLQHLLQWDGRDLDGLPQVHDQAVDIAREFGLELRMPPLMAADARHCHFVEQSAVFVTVEGDVAPCQFLWHEVVCHMDGQRKYIQPWHFGNINDAPLEDIWNDTACVAFRKEVLEYAYPYCSNCTFVPCDDIIGESYPFANDCLGHTIPCGHCMWCMGGLQCLL
jgi:putative metalloenzyme radical SAM/SPASM domain maturase